MIPLYEQLGDSIEAAWRKTDYTDATFHSIAADALRALPAEKLDVWEPARWLAATQWVPSQHDTEARFSTAPLTLYHGPHFFVAIYYWLHGTTDVHQHTFDGAFRVLAGSSLHSTFHFETDDHFNDHFRLGRMSLRAAEWLPTGAVRPIVAGDAYIHGLFHLERPSVTLIVRTLKRVDSLPQWQYLAPYMAIDPHRHEPLQERRTQMASILLEAGPDDADALLEGLLSSSDLYGAYSLLQTACFRWKYRDFSRLSSVPPQLERYERLLAAARQLHGERVDKLQAVLDEQARQLDLVARRAIITLAEHRFFLGLVMNVPSRKHMLDVIRSRHGGVDAVDKVCDWLYELSHIHETGSAEPSVLGTSLDDGDITDIETCLRQDLPLRADHAALRSPVLRRLLQQQPAAAAIAVACATS